MTCEDNQTATDAQSWDAASCELDTGAGESVVARDVSEEPLQHVGLLAMNEAGAAPRSTAPVSVEWTAKAEGTRRRRTGESSGRGSERLPATPPGHWLE